MQGHRRPHYWLKLDGQENYVQNIEYLTSESGAMHDTLLAKQTNSIRPKLIEKDSMKDKRITYVWLGSKEQERTKNNIHWVGVVTRDAIET